MRDNLLYVHDNLDVMHGMNSQSVDLIYLDPPFNSKRIYRAPIGSVAEIKASKKSTTAGFHDIWVWDEDVDIRLEAFLRTHNDLFNFIVAVGSIHGLAMKAYLTFMAQRMVEMHRIIKDTGSIYLHCDPTASHYLKIIMDRVFGQRNFRNEVLWCYTGPGSPGMRQFPRKHEAIFWYSKGKKWTFNRDTMRVPYKDPKQTLRQRMDAGRGMSAAEIERYRERGKLRENWWSDIALAVRSPKERTGYPTQKPLALLHRILEASSNEGDVVLDPFCGCATTCVAAHNLHRQWIGIDISSVAIDLVMDRLSEEKDGQVKLFKNFEIRRKPAIRTDITPWTASKTEAKTILFGEQKGYCNGCNRFLEIDLFHIDHIYPQSKGGGWYKDNLQLLCPTCNTSKGKNSMEWLNRRLKEREEAKNAITY